ncbi:MAG: D-sedoheptulose 7-phosphate isomerase [Candidatus Peregrinibacteria bacterium Greene1014_49]|nr:MAG: D-sedoheptulose 7-phosphate isomerase [Candidatus Peregrinibacteria bacterium Greene1014_49]
MADSRSITAREHLQRSARTFAALEAQTIPVILEAADMIADSLKNGGKILICGNGGSAADSQHMAAEFVSRLRADRPRAALSAIALTTDTSFLTAYANDEGYEGVFARQVEAHGKKGDVLLGITTSGTSKNVLQAFVEAKKRGVITIGLTGSKGLGTQADCVIAVPSEDQQCTQEAHLAVEHIICELVEDRLFPRNND